MVYQHIHIWTGNKYLELKKFFKENKNIVDEINKYNTIVECYGGSFGFIRVLYSIYNFKDKDFIVYDTNTDLIKFYKFIQSLDYEEYKEFLDEYNKIGKYLCDNFPLYGNKKETNEKKKPINRQLGLDYINNNIKNDKLKYLIINNIFTHSIVTNSQYKPINEEDYNLIKKIKFINEPFQFDNLDKKTLYYMDPPYLLQTPVIYKTESIENLLKFLLNDFEKYNIILNHEKNILFDTIFKHIKELNYTKTYNVSKNKKYISFFYNL